MKKWGLCLMVCLLSGCLLQENEEQVKVILFNQTGDEVGKAYFSERRDGVHVDLELEGLTPGFHGLHLHERGTCDAPMFQTAGNHFNPSKKAHGLLHPDGAHLGDLKNIEADDKGKVKQEFDIQEATLRKGKANSLTAKEGTALIITEEADDGMTQISGDSGNRIVCGEVK